MESIESLRRKIVTAGELGSVVRTMKALAAVSIHQYQKAVEALTEYNHTIEKGLQIALRGNSEWAVNARPAPRNRLIAVVLGSDQGMCGQFNELIGEYARKSLEKRNGSAGHHVLLVVGSRIEGLLSDLGLNVREMFPVPNGVTGIIALVQDLLIKIEEARSLLDLDQVIVFYNKQVTNTKFTPCQKQLLPVDLEWLNRLKKREWPCRSIPTYTMEWDRVFSALIWQYLFVSIYRAVAESMASENAGRLASMERAEKNIQERIEELNLKYNQCRQLSITEELLDIVAGYEAITSKSKKSNECLL
ncbi:MAG: F0F1 ATP synthase subunit gamma [Deltaproteobacteria bacterium]|nr:F0F1 ATP synthase subunit gamma [Deltaproteobacteria bacterium]